MMDRFDREVIEACETRARQREQAARRVAARGWPDHAATLRGMAQRDRMLAEDVRQAAEWREDSQCQRAPF